MEEEHQNPPQVGRRRGRPKLLSDAELRDQVLAAAMSAFIEQGFARTTTTDIARRARVSKRDLYRLFADKTELFAAAIGSRRHLILDLPRSGGERHAPLEALRLIFRLDLSDRDADERDAMLNLVARESLLIPELNAILYDTRVIQSRELLMDWLHGQIAEGALPDHDVGRLAGMLMDVVFGALLPRRKRKGAVDRTAQAQDIMARLEIVLAGLNSISRKDSR
ncbi:TetR/AcrR family transcriptional regulator [Jiella sonneratiae]|uniref:TetR/AcrR family transcriptional regulator n=1 Tax=Jiella sonneratiae TaxID=2816856 RepID=A0ABS3J577_9HYPH|nr:TetR/AcrR family transcriptional regulator [Jiella sonneratiae]MBO0904237.1 TetR/AcrR family transcriptional regulator [Jiella sonneratiae]